MNDFAYPVITSAEFIIIALFNSADTLYFNQPKSKFPDQTTIKMDETDDKLHIIISGERGRVFRIPCSKKKLLIWTGTACSLVLCAGVLLVAILFSTLEEKQVFNRIHLFLTSQDPSVILLSEEELRFRELHNKIDSLKERNRQQRIQFEQEKELLLSETIEELNSRSRRLEELFHSIGVIVPQKNKIIVDKAEEDEGSGGLFHEISPLEAQKDELVDRIDLYLEKAGTIPLGRPLYGRVTSAFGKRRDPFNGRMSFHDGVDIRGRRGQKIYATADGVIAFAGRNGGYGKYIRLRHAGGYETAYGHMRRILVRKGQKVKRGEVIGLVGNTGRSTGPHLHYEIRCNNRLLNPAKYMRIAEALKKSSR